MFFSMNLSISLSKSLALVRGLAHSMLFFKQRLSINEVLLGKDKSSGKLTLSLSDKILIIS